MKVRYFSDMADVSGRLYCIWIFFSLRKARSISSDIASIEPSTNPALDDRMESIRDRRNSLLLCLEWCERTFLLEEESVIIRGNLIEVVTIFFPNSSEEHAVGTAEAEISINTHVRKSRYFIKLKIFTF